MEILNKILDFASGYIDGISPIRTVICSILFLTVYALYLNFVRSQTGLKTITWIDGKIKAETNRFAWNDVLEKQIARGVDFYVPKMLQPHYYIMIHIFIILAAAVILLFLAPKMAFLSILAVFIPTAYYKGKDKKDNEEIIADVMSISSALTVQITGGEYLGSAICECKDIVRNKRFKKALTDFDRSIKMGSLTLVEAINELGKHFTSPEIQTLCIILRQGIETGRTLDCASDLAKQCLSARESEFDARKAHLDRTTTIAILLVFADGIAFIMYGFMSQLSALF